MKSYAFFIVFLLLMKKVHSNELDEFKALVLSEIEALKEDSAKKDIEIAAKLLSQTVQQKRANSEIMWGTNCF